MTPRQRLAEVAGDASYRRGPHRIPRGAEPDSVVRVTMAVLSGAETVREVADVCNMGLGTAAKYLAFARAAGTVVDLADAAGKKRRATTRPGVVIVPFGAATLEDGNGTADRGRDRRSGDSD